MPANASSEHLEAIEHDDLDAYIATFDERERRDLSAAEAAIDIAILLFRARERRGLSQSAAARLAGLQQQAVSRLEHPTANPQLESVQAYLGALGYALELKAIDVETGEVAAEVVLPPTILRKTRRTPPRSRRGPRSHRRQPPVDRLRQVATG
jgi:transcriptional regulator with XRE-family HTH domain